MPDWPSCICGSQIQEVHIQVQIQIQNSFKFKDVQARGVLHSDLPSQTDTTAQLAFFVHPTQDICSSKLKKRFAETQILGDVDFLWL